MFCSNCGAPIPDNSLFCVACGAPVVNPIYRNQPHDQQIHLPPGAIQTGPLPPGQLPPTGYVLIPQDQLERIQKRSGMYAAAQQLQKPYNQVVSGTDRGPDRLSQSDQAPQTPMHAKSKREQVPDPTFTKFVDAPEAPLPFWVIKIIIAFVTFLGMGFCVWKAIDLGTIRLLTSGIRENVPGIPCLIMTLIWFIGAVSALLSRRSRGAAGTSGIAFLAAAGMAFTTKQNCPEVPMMTFAILSVVFAFILLISAAGGIHVDLDAQQI